MARPYSRRVRRRLKKVAETFGPAPRAGRACGRERSRRPTTVRFAPMVSIHVSGPLRLLIDGKAVSPLHPGARALIAWLVLLPGLHARDFVREELGLNKDQLRSAVHELKPLKAEVLL